MKRFYLLMICALICVQTFAQDKWSDNWCNQWNVMQYNAQIAGDYDEKKYKFLHMCENCSTFAR